MNALAIYSSDLHKLGRIYLFLNENGIECSNKFYKQFTGVYFILVNHKPPKKGWTTIDASLKDVKGWSYTDILNACLISKYFEI